MSIEKAFLLGLEFAALCREENKIVKQAHQSYALKIEQITARKNEIINLIYEKMK